MTRASSLAHPSQAALAEAVADDVPAVLLQYQVEAIELSATTPFLLIEKSRRTGISYAFAADAVLTASPAINPQNVYYIAYNLDMTREFIGYCGEFAKSFDQVASSTSEILFDDGSEKGIKALRIDFPSGKAIVALSSKPRSLRGMQGKVIIDEAAFHDGFEELLKAAMALTMWGGSVVVISTHDGADNPFNTTIEDVRAGKLEGKVMRLTLETALAQGLFKRICLRTGQIWTAELQAEWERALRKRYGDGAAEELDVIPARGSGTYLPRSTIEAAMSPDLPVVRLRCPDGFELRSEDARTDFVEDWLEEHVRPLLDRFDQARSTFFGQDFARSGDVSPIAFGQYDERLNLITRFVLEMRNVPFREQEFILNWILARVPLFTAGKMDATGNGSALAEFAQQTWGADRIEALKATESMYLSFMPKLKARLEDRTMLIPRDEGVLDDLRMIKLIRGVPMIPRGSINSKADGAKGKRHGDVAIALMNLVAAADEDIVPIEFHTTGQRRTLAGQMDHSTRGFGTVRRRKSWGDY